VYIHIAFSIEFILACLTALSAKPHERVEKAKLGEQGSENSKKNGAASIAD
jgi:hypothetical protein